MMTMGVLLVVPFSRALLLDFTKLLLVAPASFSHVPIT